MGGEQVKSSQVRDYYDTHQEITRAKSVEQVFKSKSINPLLDPARFKNGIRESCDSPGCPHSRAIVIGFDETGSMGEIPFYFVREGFPTLINMILNSNLGYGPQIAVVGIGDVKSDKSPLQFSQFEADTRMIDNLPLIYLEGNGGGNNGESYNIPWWCLAKHTKIDCFNNRGEKGIYISIGDDKPHPNLERDELMQIFGNYDGLEKSYISTLELRDMALNQWHLFHILIRREGRGYGGFASENVHRTWQKLLGNHIAVLDNYEYVAELIATILKIQSGVDKFDAIREIKKPETQRAVRKALQDFEPYDEEPCKVNKEQEGSIEFI